MSILDDIRSQPPHIRAIFMWLCVIITFSIVTYFWFQSEGRQVRLALNGGTVTEQDGRALAQTTSQPANTSILATIGRSAGDFRSSLAQLLGLTHDKTFEFNNSNAGSSAAPVFSPVPVATFPAESPAPTVSGTPRKANY